MTELEKKAGLINRSPSINGIYNWMCETCGKEWQEQEDDYDRTTDCTNWPVQCSECLSEWVENLKNKRD